MIEVDGFRIYRRQTTLAVPQRERSEFEAANRGQTMQSWFGASINLIEREEMVSLVRNANRYRIKELTYYQVAKALMEAGRPLTRGAVSLHPVKLAFDTTVPNAGNNGFPLNLLLADPDDRLRQDRQELGELLFDQTKVRLKPFDDSFVPALELFFVKPPYTRETLMAARNLVEEKIQGVGEITLYGAEVWPSLAAMQPPGLKKI